jgi:hypothetical protein
MTDPSPSTPAGGARIDRAQLLREVAGAGDRAGVWKNVEAGLTGDGDIDLAVPPADWARVTERFRRWAGSQGLGPIVICRHVPGSVFLVALDPSGGPFTQLDMRGTARLRGAPAFVADDLDPHMVLDPRGFRRLRPGVEGLLKLALVGFGRGGRPRADKLRREHVRELLASDPEGARAGATTLGIAAGSLCRAAEAAAAGGWDRRALLLVEGRTLLSALYHPRGLVDRARERQAKRRCPVLRAGILNHRQVPGDPEAWLRQVRRDHEVLATLGEVSDAGSSQRTQIDA